MSAATDASARRGVSRRTRQGIFAAIVVVVIAFLVLGTRVVPMDGEQPVAEGAFDAETYGPENFPAVQEGVIERAVDTATLAEALASDQSAAESEYAVESSGGPVFSVTMSGTFGEGGSGILDFHVDGLPDDLTVRVQTGPAINGTELRDATGEIVFGQFTNQIDFQNAAAALNEEMKAQVLDGVDVADLEGRTATVTGAFTLINPEMWLVTPVHLEVG